MKPFSPQDIVGQEVQRLQQEIAALDRQIDEQTAQRNRLQLLLSILQSHSQEQPKPAARKSLQKQPEKATRARRAEPPKQSAPSPAPFQALQVGRPVRMIEGVYGGLDGIIRWCKQTHRGMIYTLSLRNQSGRIVRTQVTERSLGQKWQLLQTPAETGTPADAGTRPSRRKRDASSGEGASKPKKVGRPRREAPSKAESGKRDPTRKAPPSKPRRARRATRPERILQRNTRVKVLSGKYAGWEGVIAGIRDKTTAITYALNLEGPDGAVGRTQVNHGSLGTSWVELDAPLATQNEEPAPPPKVVRRRATQAPSEEAAKSRKAGPDVAVIQAEAPVDPTAEAREAVPSGGEQPLPGPDAETTLRYTPSSPVLPEKTRIRMLSGRYLGHTGVIVRVQPHPGPRADAIYSVLIDMESDSDPEMTSVRHSSLGRSWTVL